MTCSRGPSDLPAAPSGRRALCAGDLDAARTFPRARPVVGAPVMVAIGPAAALPGGSAAAGCPDLLQRPRSRRGAREESLIFRASSRGRSRRGAPLQQIWTSSRPGTPQEPHPPQFSTGSMMVLALGTRVRLWSGCRRPALGTRPAPRTYPSAFPNGGGSACSMHIPRPPRGSLPRAGPRDAPGRSTGRFDAQRFRPRRRARRRFYARQRARRSAAGRRA